MIALGHHTGQSVEGEFLRLQKNRRKNSKRLIMPKSKKFE